MSLRTRVPASIVAALLVPAGLAAEPAAPDPAPVGRTIRVPIDRGDPRAATAELYYELGAPFDSAKPTVLVVADGQQFYVQRGRVRKIQDEYFGDGFNVVGLVGRGFTEPFQRAVRDADGKVDWARAWRVLRAGEWVEDLDAVRRDLLGDSGEVMLFGQSGGAYLAQQYLAAHGMHVSRALLAASVDPFIVGEFHLDPVRFTREIAACDPALPGVARAALARYSEERDAVVMTLQRQNFFVPPDRLCEERGSLLRALAAGDDARFTAAREAYQVDAVRDLLDGPVGPTIRVRMYEFIQPTGWAGRVRSDGLRPDLENSVILARPLLDLHAAGKNPAPSLDVAAFHRLRTEVFVVIGRYDHTVDYRGAMILAATFPSHGLFLADDDHVLHRMKDAGVYAPLIRAFLRSGLDGEATRAALAAAEPLRWRE